MCRARWSLSILAVFLTLPSAFAAVKTTERFQCETNGRYREYSAEGKALGEVQESKIILEGIHTKWEEDGVEFSLNEYFHPSAEQSVGGNEKPRIKSQLRKYKVTKNGFRRTTTGEMVLTFVNEAGEESEIKRQVEFVELVAGNKSYIISMKNDGVPGVTNHIKENVDVRLGERLEIRTWMSPTLALDEARQVVREQLSAVTICTYSQTRAQ